MRYWVLIGLRNNHLKGGDNMVDLSKVTIKLRTLLEIQCDDGNWNYDPYMFGMANGMILMPSTLEDEDPEFLTTPKVWGKDKAPSCSRCNGDGLVYRHELSNPDFDGMATYLDNDNVKYCCDECDGEG